MKLTPEQLARTIRNIEARAETLFSPGTGYYWFPSEFTPGTYKVVAPTKYCGPRIITTIYTVTLTDTQSNCDCESHKYYGTCKHLLAVSYELAREAALARQGDRILGAENSEFGIDADAGAEW